MSLDSLVDKNILLIQAGIFLASYAVLRGLVFGPYTQLLRAREERSSLLKEKAARQQDEALKIRESYETFIKTERRNTQNWIDEERKQISDVEKRSVQLARESANEKLKQMRSRLAQELSAVRKGLAPRVSEYASQLASTILGKKVVVAAQDSDNGRKEASLS